MTFDDYFERIEFGRCSYRWIIYFHVFILYFYFYILGYEPLKYLQILQDIKLQFIHFLKNPADEREEDAIL